MSSASVWLGGVQSSRRIASQSCPTRDNLPAQHEVIAICCHILGNTFRVHLPCCGAPGLSTLQLKTFASLDYTVPYISLERVPCFWLVLKEDSGCYFVGLCQLRMDNEKEKWKSQHWYVTEAVIASLHQFNQNFVGSVVSLSQFRPAPSGSCLRC
jgi:hypothetical protein